MQVESAAYIPRGVLDTYGKVQNEGDGSVDSELLKRKTNFINKGVSYS